MEHIEEDNRIYGIVVTGLTCCGKSTVAKHIADKYCFFHIEASTYMRKLWEESNLKHESIGKFAINIIHSQPQIVPRIIYDEINKIGKNTVIISGFRSINELSEMEVLISIKRIIYIETPFIVRYERARMRKREDAPKTHQEMHEIDREQISMGVLEIKSHKNTFVVNYNGDDNTIIQIENIIENCFSHKDTNCS